MPRTSLGSVVVLAVFTAGLMAADAQKDRAARNDKNKATQATVTKVDAKKGAITLRMKDRKGKDVEKTFTLAEDVRLFDSSGKVVAIDVFRSGNDVLVFEREGKIKRIQKTDKGKEKKNTEAKPPEKRTKDR
jgi:hypothetical protein